MSTYSLTHLSDRDVLDGLAALVAADRQTTASLLAHLAEVDERKLYLPAACSSLHVYCVQVLHLSEDAAFKRIRAARAARRFPAIFAAVADGRLHLAAVVLLAPHLTDQDADELIVAASHRTKAEIELLLAQRHPRPDVPTLLEALPADPSSVAAVAPEPPPAPPPAKVAPLAPERFALQVAIGQACTTGSCAGQGAGVQERDGEQCSFVSDDGRCTERGFLEFDHVVPAARGGQPTVPNLRILCAAHKEYEADRTLGAAFMEERRARAEMEADVTLACAGSAGRPRTLVAPSPRARTWR